MKKGITILLTFVFLLSLAGCGLLNKTPSGTADPESKPTGGSQAETFENKITLSIDKTKYDKEERIEVTMNFADVNKDSAVIVIVSSDLPHGKTAPKEEAAEEYRWLADFSEIPFFLWAPDKDGMFDVRVYTGVEGEELASATFAVGSATLPSGTGTTPPKDGASVKKAYFNPPKAIYMDVRVGGSTATEGIYSFALLDGNYSYTLNSDGVFFHTSAEVKTHYCPYGDGWRIDNSDGYGFGQVPEEDLIYEMTDYLDTFYQDAESSGYYNNISKYYVGTETVCYRECYVYEIKDDGHGVYKKFWIDPENGATLKYTERENGETKYEFEVTQYNLLGPVWTATMRPDYAAVTDTLY